MFGLFKRDPAARLRKEYHFALGKALEAQRNGKIREYSFLTAEAEALKAKLDELERPQAA